MSNRLIVKVQFSIVTNASDRQVLVYDRSRKTVYEGSATPEIGKVMRGSLKKYFFAHMEGTEIVLDEEAPAQDW